VADPTDHNVRVKLQIEQESLTFYKQIMRSFGMCKSELATRKFSESPESTDRENPDDSLVFIPVDTFTPDMRELNTEADDIVSKIFSS
jgi:hypothetical protein